MKKLLSVFLVAVLLVTAMPLGAFEFKASAATSGTTGDCTWTLNGTTLTISGNGIMGNYTVSNSSPWSKNITEVIVENGVTRIGDYAFYSCYSLTSVTLPDSVTNIGNCAFFLCVRLTNIYVSSGNNDYSSNNGVLFNKDKTHLICYPEGKTDTSYSIPNSVTSIGPSAFYSCDSLTSITIPNSVISIGDYAFDSCDSLTSVTIPNSVTNIGDYAFYSCYSLTSVTLPDSVTNIGNCAFSICVRLTNIYVSSGNNDYSSNNGVLFNKDKTHLICYPAGKTNTSYSIPNSVISIGNDAFYFCDSLTSVTLPDSVTNIGDRVFGNCKSLISITIGDGVASISEMAFFGCGNLANITIPNSVTSIGYSAFSGCSKLTSIAIPDSVKSIGKRAFFDCENLTSITIPNSVTSIDEGAFYNCISLENIYYRGSSIDKLEISIGSDNNYLLNATWYYNRCISGAEHTYDNVCDVCCNICDYIRTDCHVYDNNCDTACNICSEIRTTIIHTYSNECDRDCNICGEFRKAPHKYDNVCDDTCNLCGNEREIDNHFYSSDCDISCNECGAIRTAKEHSYDNSCDTVCNLCDATRSIIHTYNNTCDTTCNVCGATRTITHTYDSDCDASCNVCGELRTPPHKSEGVSCDFINATNYPFSFSNGIYSSTNKTDSSSATATITAKESGTIIIKYYTSTESGWDNLIIKLNSNTMVTASGETSWTTINTPINAGDKIHITYSKDVSVSGGRDIVKFEFNQKTIKSCDEPLLCSDCNEILEYPKEHEYDGECDTVCNKCEKVRIANHIYSNSCDIDCNVCGFIRTVEHAFTNSCDGECDICYETRKPPHDYSNACDTECNLCGKKRTASDHTYDNEWDTICNVCEKTRVITGTTGDCTWTLDGTVLTISGNGAMANDYNYSAPWGTLMTEVIIENNVTNIGDYAFHNCTSLTNVSIGDSVTSIGASAFYNCTSLTNLSIGDDVTSIGPLAFCDCIGLTSITISDSVTSIDASAFYNTGYYNNSNNWENNVLYIGNHLICAKTSISGGCLVKDGTVTIGEYAFSECYGLTSITIPNSVTSIGDVLFDNCSKLTSINVSSDNNYYSSVDGVLFNKNKTTLVRYPVGKTNTSYNIPEGVTNIGDFAFCWCFKLTNITIPNSVTSIGISALLDCKNLTNVIIPDSVTSMGNYAFENCSKLTSITIPNSIISIGSSAFASTSLKTVYYLGNSEDKSKISIGSNNSSFTNATWYYNSCIASPDHSYGDNLVCDECGYKNFVLGDIDGTGVVDLSDVNAIAKYFAGWDVDVNNDALDVNGDGLVNLNDLVHIAQYVAQWEGIVLH